MSKTARKKDYHSRNRHRRVELRPGDTLEALADRKAMVKVIFPPQVRVRVVKRD